MDRELLTVSDVSESLGCHRRTVLRWIRAGKFEATKFPGAMGWRIDKESFDRFLDSQKTLGVARRELNGEGSRSS